MDNFEKKILSVKCYTSENAYVLEDGTQLLHGGVVSDCIGKWRYLTLLYLPSGWFRLRQIEIPELK